MTPCNKGVTTTWTQSLIRGFSSKDDMCFMLQVSYESVDLLIIAPDMENEKIRFMAPVLSLCCQDRLLEKSECGTSRGKRRSSFVSCIHYSTTRICKQFQLYFSAQFCVHECNQFGWFPTRVASITREEVRPLVQRFLVSNDMSIECT